MNSNLKCQRNNCSGKIKYFCTCDPSINYCKTHGLSHRCDSHSSLILISSMRSPETEMESQRSINENPEVQKIEYLYKEILKNLSTFIKTFLYKIRNALPSPAELFNIETNKLILDYLNTFSQKILEKQVPDIPQFKVFHHFKTMTIDNKFYEGQFDESNNGYGLVQDKGKFYMGGIVNGHYEGRGIMFYENCEYYHGDWNAGKRKGNGIFVFKDKSRYTGEFDGKFQGYGEMVYPNGDVYQGSFRDGKRNGFGKYSTKKSEFADFKEADWIDGEIKTIYAVSENGIYRRFRS